MLHRLLIHHYRQPSGALRKISSLVSNPPPTQRYQLYLAAAAPLAAVTSYAAFAWSTGYGKLEVSDRDLVSDETLWALYERWCRHHKIHRSAEDMRQRFPMFKWHAHHVYKINNHLDLGYTIALNHFSDEIEEEAMNGCSLYFQNWAKDIKKLEETKEAPCGDVCAICCQEFSSSHPYVVIGCKHEFHPLCIFKWRFISSKCRVCWQPITPKDPTSEEFEEEEGKVLWGLYETWCCNQRLYKSPEDMKRGFNKVKDILESPACQRDIQLSNKKHCQRELPVDDEEEEEDRLSWSTTPPVEAHH